MLLPLQLNLAPAGPVAQLGIDFDARALARLSSEQKTRTRFGAAVRSRSRHSFGTLARGVADEPEAR